MCGEHFQLPSEEETVYCLVKSDPSNILSVTPTAPPLSPPLRLESIHPDGIDVTWVTPQQYGEATISVKKKIFNQKRKFYFCFFKGLSNGYKWKS